MGGDWPRQKKNERKGTDDASPDEADGIHRISNQEMTRPRLTQINDVAKENRKDEERLQSNADERTDVESLLCRAIEENVRATPREIYGMCPSRKLIQRMPQAAIAIANHFKRESRSWKIRTPRKTLISGLI